MEGPSMGREPVTSISLRVLMFPWFAYGHISPFLELAKKLTDRGLHVHLCSTPINLSSISKKITEKYSHSIELVEYHLPILPDLPSHYHTTNGLPPHLMPILKKAIQMSKPTLSKISETLKPDLIIYDVRQSWAASITSLHNIPAVLFQTSSATVFSYFSHMAIKPALKYPFPAIHLLDFEQVNVRRELESVKDDARAEEDLIDDRPPIGSSGLVMLMKTSREIEGRYMDYIAEMLKWKTVPVGPLVQDSATEGEDTELREWLGRKKEYSTVYVSFGSEYFPSKEEMKEIALGLELSSVNFIWVLRYPQGETVDVVKALPEGFLERVKDRGRIVEGWVTQAKILGHSSIGGFVSHCGWNSLLESMVFGVPIIAMPMIHDQPLNARLVVEIGAAVEVMRDENGRLRKQEIARVIKDVLIGNIGQAVRRKMKDVSAYMQMTEKEDLDGAVAVLSQLCEKSSEKSACII